MAAEVVDALGVADLAVGGDVVVVGHPVLEHIEGTVAVLVADPAEQLAERRRLDLPVHGGELEVGTVHLHRPEVGAERVRRRGDRHPVPGRTRLGHPGAGADRPGGVEVHPQEVRRLGDDPQIAVLHHGEARYTARVVRQHVGGILAPEHRVEEEPVEVAVGEADGGEVVLVLAGRPGRLEVEIDPHPGRGDRCPEGLHRPPVGEQEVVGGGRGQPDVLPPGGVLALGVAEP